MMSEYRSNPAQNVLHNVLLLTATYVFPHEDTDWQCMSRRNYHRLSKLEERRPYI